SDEDLVHRILRDLHDANEHRLPSARQEISDKVARVIASWWYRGDHTDAAAFVSTGAVPTETAPLWRRLVPDYHALSPRERCPTCSPPAGTYLPKLSWDGPDPEHSGEPGSGHPDRGAFTARFSGGPDHPDQPMLAHVSRRDWWDRWRRYDVIELHPHHWRAEF